MPHATCHPTPPPPPALSSYGENLLTLACARTGLRLGPPHAATCGMQHSWPPPPRWLGCTVRIDWKLVNRKCNCEANCKSNSKMKPPSASVSVSVSAFVSAFVSVSASASLACAKARTHANWAAGSKPVAATVAAAAVVAAAAAVGLSNLQRLTGDEGHRQIDSRNLWRHKAIYNNLKAAAKLKWTCSCKCNCISICIYNCICIFIYICFFICIFCCICICWCKRMWVERGATMTQYWFWLNLATTFALQHAKPLNSRHLFPAMPPTVANS